MFETIIYNLKNTDHMNDKHIKIKRVLAYVKGFKYVNNTPIHHWIKKPQETAETLKEMMNLFNN